MVTAVVSWVAVLHLPRGVLEANYGVDLVREKGFRYQIKYATVSVNCGDMLTHVVSFPILAASVLYRMLDEEIRRWVRLNLSYPLW